MLSSEITLLVLIHAGISLLDLLLDLLLHLFLLSLSHRLELVTPTVAAVLLVLLACTLLLCSGMILILLVLLRSIVGRLHLGDIHLLAALLADSLSLLLFLLLVELRKVDLVHNLRSGKLLHFNLHLTRLCSLHRFFRWGRGGFLHWLWRRHRCRFRCRCRFRLLLFHWSRLLLEL